MRRKVRRAESSPPLVADTGGLLRALACRPDGQTAWPAYAHALATSRLVVVPDLVLAEVDYFLRAERAAMRKLVGDILDPGTTYELSVTTPVDLVRALHIDARFASLELGLVDATVCSVAERRGISRILTTDIRDFTAVRVGPRYQDAFTLVPDGAQ
ncbi:MAG: type II toxin-antitoxin system VapC family toxin [Polyangiaceae bacterium]